MLCLDNDGVKQETVIYRMTVEMNRGVSIFA